MRSVSIVGCGYTGLRLAARWLARGYSVQGFATRTESLEQIAAAGAVAQFLELDSPIAGGAMVEDLVLDSPNAGDGATAAGLNVDSPNAGDEVGRPRDVRPVGRLSLDGHVIYYMVPPAPQGDRDLRLERFLGNLAGHPARIIYLSTTGVYGDRGGALVDEETPPAPQTGRAVRRLAAENALRGWADSRRVSWCILRVPGIYGPGRLPLERLRRAAPAIVPEEASPGNRIHVDDLVTACVAAGVAAPADRRIYNVTDGSDDSLTLYLQRVARIGRLPPPPLIGRAEAQQRFTESTWSFLGESRRVDNRRMLAELDVALAYHDLDAGIRASL